MKFGLVAGEASGDLLGAGLIRALREQIPGATFEGVAGPAMVAAGCEQWEPADSLAVMGLVEPLRHIPRLLRLRRELVRRWIASPPDVFIGIDAPDFNLGLECKLRQAGIRTAHYVSPSIWAWRAGRVRKIRKAANTVLCILPFEPPLYEKHGVHAVFVGHPKAHEAPEHVDQEGARQALGLGADAVVAVMPGSRRGEVQRLGSILANAASRIVVARPDAQFVTPLASPRLRPLFEQQLVEAGMIDRFMLVDGQSQVVMAAADVVLQASGTAVLEAALLRKPAVAAYRLSPLTYLIIRYLLRVNMAHYTLPNLLAGEALVPEFMQGDARPGAIAAAVLEFLDDPDRRHDVAERFDRLRRELALDADQRAAAAVIELARQ
jgi:lipid-A-disaccharide synthase